MKGGKIRKEMMYVRNRERKSKRGKGGVWRGVEVV